MTTITLKRRVYTLTQDPGILPTSIFGDDGASSEFSYHDWLTSSNEATVTEGDDYFDVG